MYVRTYSTHIRRANSTYVRTYVRTYARAYVRTHVRTCVRMRKRGRTCARTNGRAQRCEEAGEGQVFFPTLALFPPRLRR